MAKELNESQKKAVGILDGPLLILAGAGSGKTTTMLYRICEMIKAGVNPRNILAITFTNKAANEMKQRMKGILGEKRVTPFMSTFHSFGYRMLKTFGGHLGYGKDIILLDADASKKKIKDIVAEMYGTCASDKKLVSAIVDKISYYKDLMLSPEDAKKSSDALVTEYGLIYPSLIYEEYENQKKVDNAVDFDDLIEKTVLLLRMDNVREKANKRWKYICVDEYQDTSHAQAEMVKHLAGKDKNVCVIGDDYQCQPAGTKVLLADGFVKNIQDVQIFDTVLSYDMDSGEYLGGMNLKEGKRVVGKCVCLCDGLITIITDSGKKSSYSPNHRCIVEKDGVIMEVQAKDIVPFEMSAVIPRVDGDGKHINTYEKITRKINEEHETVVFGLKIEGTGTYVADRMLTHNSIYAFRGADITNILTFKETFPECSVITLNENYRSTEHIVDGAAGLIRNNEDQFHKDLCSMRGEGDKIRVIPFNNDNEEALAIAQDISSLIENGEDPNEIAILYRKNSISAIFDNFLSTQGIPHKVWGSLSLADRKEVKDVLAYCSLAAGLNDIASLERVLNTPKRGIGTVKMKRMLAAVRGREKEESLLHVLQKEKDAGAKQFCEILETLQEEIHVRSLPDFITYVIDRTGLSGYYTEIDKKEEKEPGEGRMENLAQLVYRAHIHSEIHHSSNGSEAMMEFLAEMLLSTDMDNADDKTPKVSLMTEHKAKGLEFKHVYVVAAEQPYWGRQDPDNVKKEIEEERRLFYVSMTRAKDCLTISCARTRYEYGEYKDKKPICFINEIPSRDMVLLTCDY